MPAALTSDVPALEASGPGRSAGWESRQRHEAVTAAGRALAGAPGASVWGQGSHPINSCVPRRGGGPAGVGAWWGVGSGRSSPRGQAVNGENQREEGKWEGGRGGRERTGLTTTTAPQLSVCLCDPPTHLGLGLPCMLQSGAESQERILTTRQTAAL